ncbi:hypothetical protein D3C87_2192100 [compost metagenome]
MLDRVVVVDVHGLFVNMPDSRAQLLHRKFVRQEHLFPFAGRFHFIDHNLSLVN